LNFLFFFCFYFDDSLHPVLFSCFGFLSCRSSFAFSCLTFFLPLAEWWVHSRPHCCGHQLHYDSDESRIEKGGSPQHPVASCILYLSPSEIGGPTLISNQMLNQGLGTHTWLVETKENRLFVFNAKYLHGVIPGVGPIPSSNEDSRRLTLMIGFWRSLEAKDKGIDCVGAGQPFPLTRQVPNSLTEAKTRFTWPHEMKMRSDRSIVNDEPDTKPFSPSDLSQYGIQSVEPFWIPLTKNPCETDDYKSFYQGF
jgi:hypothetical protein